MRDEGEFYKNGEPAICSIPHGVFVSFQTGIQQPILI